MSEKTVHPIVCSRCGHPWEVDLKLLEIADLEGYRGAGDPAKIRLYRARCPKCHFYNILEISIKEGEDGR